MPARNDNAIYCKISGAGLGDCVIGLSQANILDSFVKDIEKNIAVKNGVRVFKITPHMV